MKIANKKKPSPLSLLKMRLVNVLMYFSLSHTRHVIHFISTQFKKAFSMLSTRCGVRAFLRLHKQDQVS